MAPVMPLKDSRARAAEALRLRGRRKTWTEISQQLGFQSRDGARLAVGRLVKSVVADPDTPAMDRAVSAASLEEQENRLWGLFDAAVDAGRDDVAASLSKELRSLVTDRAKLTGTYAPTRTEVDLQVSTSATAIVDRMESELLALAARQRGEAIDAEVIE